MVKAVAPGTSPSTGIGTTLNLREGVWMPPSENTAKLRGKIFSIQNPEDLLDFMIEDERLSVVKVWASWCKTCSKFDIRYRKLASQFGGKYDDAKTGNAGVNQMGRVRFAEMQYDNPNNKEICHLFNATRFPYILMYKGSKGKVKEFQCSPADFQMLIDAVNELADPNFGEDALGMENIDALRQELEDLGLTDRR